VVGNSEAKSVNRAAGSKPLNDAQEAAEPRAPLLDGWTKPALALVLTGEQHGYFEPCGCSELQSGGVYRRADLVEKMEERGWDVASLDLGGLSRRTDRHSQIKFEELLGSLKDMHYKVVGLGPEELAFGTLYLLSQFVEDPGNPDANLAFLSANVGFFGAPGQPGGPKASRVFEVGGVKIGVTSILGTKYGETSVIVKNDSNMTIEDPVAVLPKAIESLKAAGADLLVLLSHASLEETRKIAGKFNDFDIILSAGGPEDPDPEPMTAGKAMLLNVGRKGKYVGVLGYYPENSTERFRFELVDLDKERFGDNPTMVEHMKNFQARIKAEQVAGNHHDNRGIPHPSGAQFVGAEKCGECHTKAYEHWLETPHARAFESLSGPRKGHADHGITRIFDPECLSCHVTGWNPQEYFRYDSGFINKVFANSQPQREMAEKLRGNQCENCHGPGSRHIQLIEADETEEAAKQVRVTLQEAKESMCFECHDHDNSPHFKFDSYWEPIAHPWRD
jgi:hypothetical protein